ncbi:hypothetical protein [Streptomyces sp. NPDC058457]|uniref:hypothetical protein n=1 Tax=Streptomyces sp. NPDC058457 TaxID=3346507 RepID=UPI00365AD382
MTDSAVASPVADVNGDGYADAAIGAPANDITSLTDPGTAWVVRGTAHGLTPRGTVSTAGGGTVGLPALVNRTRGPVVAGSLDSQVA